MTDAEIIYIPGPQGPVGPKGGSGDSGPRGYAGTDGHGIYSGKGRPPDALGDIGDFWLDITPGAYVIYGPRVSQTRWPIDGQSLIGPTGRGTARIFSGDGPPPDGLDFQADDIFFDKTNLRIYIAS